MSVSSIAPTRPNVAELSGTLEIVIHDSRVVQIERSEKVRFDVKGKPLSESLS